MGSVAQFPFGASVAAKPIDLTPVGRAATSHLTWSATTPAGTTITIETSLDGGLTWAPAVNGGPVLGIHLGEDLTGRMLWIRATLSTTNSAVTPVLNSISVQVNHEEWVPMGVFWTTEWQAPDDTLEATVVARDRLELLRKTTYASSVVVVNTDLEQMSLGVLQDAGLEPTDYWVDPALAAFTVPYAWFNPVSHREALRIIAEAGLAQVYCDREGLIRVEASGTGYGVTPALTITPDEYFRAQTPNKPNQVANEIQVDTQPLQSAAALEEVYKSNDPIVIPAGKAVTVTVHYNNAPVIEASASLDAPPAGVTITSATYYGWGADVTIQNIGGASQNVTLVVMGKPLTVQNRQRATAQDDASIVEHGRLRYKFPDNPLVQTLAVAQAIADTLLASSKDARRDLDLDWRGNPALLLGDRITVKGVDYHVIRQEIDWTGALSARTSGRKVSS